MGCIKHTDSKDYGDGRGGQRCIQCTRESRRRSYDRLGTSVRDYWAATRSAAKRRGVTFTLTAEEYAGIVALPCAYSGGSETVAAHIGIDRKDSDVGYTRANCVPCCYRHNMMKSNVFTHEQALDAARHYLVHCGDAPKRAKLSRGQGY